MDSEICGKPVRCHSVKQANQETHSQEVKILTFHSCSSTKCLKFRTIRYNNIGEHSVFKMNNILHQLANYTVRFRMFLKTNMTSQLASKLSNFKLK